MTLNVKDTNQTEAVVRLTQYGVRFPDGTIKWADTSSTSTQQAIMYRDRSYYLEQKYTNQHNGFLRLEEEYLKELQRNNMPTDESSLLERVTREVVVVFSNPVEVQP